MNRNIAIGSISLAFLAAALIFLLTLTPAQEGSSVSNAEDSEVRAFAEEFASKFKNVSLLADDMPAQIAREYGPYATAELIGKWQSREESAPGRHTSSPWPERMDVVAVVPHSGGIYTVEGNVIEVTNTEPMAPAAVYPVTMTVQRNGSSWVVTTFEKGAHSPLPQRVTVEGRWECLPHKDTSGPQTLECAFGIALESLPGQGGYLAVDTRLMLTYPVDFPTGTKVRIEGVLTPVENLSSIQKYDIDGIISATTITEI